MFTKKFWVQAAERMAKTAGQVLVAALGYDVAQYGHINWKFIGIMTGVSTLLSLATSLASLPIGKDSNSPSAV